MFGLLAFPTQALGLSVPGTETLLVVAAAVALGGLVHGLAGFGNAVVSTAVLATLIEPSLAVVVVILPVLAANLSLVRELDGGQVGRCLRRFWPYLAAAVVGTLVGMALLGVIPRATLALGLGILTAAYVLSRQPYVAVPGLARVQRTCFRPGRVTMAALGLVSGVAFGASNVAVQVVAYLDALDLDRETFIGVLAMLLVGISAVRVAAAFALGLYAAGALVLSLAAIVPGLVGVTVGQRLRPAIPESVRTAGTLLLLSVIAVRLLGAGLGVL